MLIENNKIKNEQLNPVKEEKNEKSPNVDVTVIIKNENLIFEIKTYRIIVYIY